LAGFVAAVVHVGDLVENALARLDESGLDSLMLERDSEGTDVVVHAHAARSRGHPLGPDEIASLLAMRPGQAFRTAVPLGDRNQSVLSAPTRDAQRPAAGHRWGTGRRLDHQCLWRAASRSR
jgi:hypothetical protein